MAYFTCWKETVQRLASVLAFTPMVGQGPLSSFDWKKGRDEQWSTSPGTICE